MSEGKKCFPQRHMTIPSGSEICFVLPGNSLILLEKGWLDGLYSKGAVSSHPTLRVVRRSQPQAGSTPWGFLLPGCWRPAQWAWRPGDLFMPSWYGFHPIYIWLLFSCLQIQPIAKLSVYPWDANTQRALMWPPSHIKSPQVHLVSPLLSVTKSM